MALLGGAVPRPDVHTVRHAVKVAARELLAAPARPHDLVDEWPDLVVERHGRGDAALAALPGLAPKDREFFLVEGDA